MARRGLTKKQGKRIIRLLEAMLERYGMASPSPLETGAFERLIRTLERSRSTQNKLVPKPRKQEGQRKPTFQVEVDGVLVDATKRPH